MNIKCRYKKKISLVTLGTYGDVVPFITLALGLQDAGYKIQVVSHNIFRSFIEAKGLEFFPIYIDPQQLEHTRVEHASHLTGNSATIFLRSFCKIARDMVVQVNDEVLEAVTKSGIIITNQLALLSTRHIAEAYNISLIIVSCIPLSPTRQFPYIFGPLDININFIYNRATYWVGDRLFSSLFYDVFNKWRREKLDMNPIPLNFSYFRIKKDYVPIVYGFSELVCERPPDWKDHIHIGGYWLGHTHNRIAHRRHENNGADNGANSEFPQIAQRLPDTLVQFIENGPPPIYFGFGSMIVKEPKKVVQMIQSALRENKQRGVFFTGWSLQDDKIARTPDLYIIEAAPHHLVFPKMKILVHHGGASTLGNGLRAGKPNIICPFIVDQFFWQQQTVRLGIGVNGPRFENLTDEHLSKMLKEVLQNEHYSERAAQIGAQLMQEDGVAKTTGIITTIIDDYIDE